MKNKVTTIILILAISVFLIFFIVNKSSNKSKNIIFIDVNKLEEKIKNKDTFILVLTQDGCSHCESYAPILEQVAKKYNIEIYNINLTNVKKEDVPKLNAIANVNGTPTTIFFTDGIEKTTLNRINGDISEDKLVKKLKKLGYIKGE